MKSIFHLILIAALTGTACAETPAPLPQMVTAGKAVAESEPADLARISTDFEKALKEASLSPSPGISAEVEAVQDAATTLLRRLGDGKFPKDSAEAKAVSSVVRSVLGKFDSLIEEDYQWQHGVANISPPPGTPNAAAGMNPDAIRDPKLRQQYLDSIDEERVKQEKNVQQKGLKDGRRIILLYVSALGDLRAAAGLSRKGLVEEFTAGGKSRELLRKSLMPEVK